MVEKNIKCLRSVLALGYRLIKEDLEPAKEKINLFVRSITSLCSRFSLLLAPSFLAFEELLLSALAD